MADQNNAREFDEFPFEQDQSLQRSTSLLLDFTADGLEHDTASDGVGPTQPVTPSLSGDDAHHAHGGHFTEAAVPTHAFHRQLQQQQHLQQQQQQQQHQHQQLQHQQHQQQQQQQQQHEQHQQHQQSAEAHWQVADDEAVKVLLPSFSSFLGNPFFGHGALPLAPAPVPPSAPYSHDGELPLQLEVTFNLVPPEAPPQLPQLPHLPHLPNRLSLRKRSYDETMSAARESIPRTMKRNKSSASDVSRESSSSSSPLRRGAWNAEEDAQLRAAVDHHRESNWKAIAALVPGRDHVQCLQRWRKVLDPAVVKGPWTEAENTLLLELVALHGTSGPTWAATIAQHIPGRTPKQVRERWKLSQDPSIRRNEWTALEDDIIMKQYDRLRALGHLTGGDGSMSWADIQLHLQTRTTNQIKTRVQTLLKAREKDALIDWTPALEAQLRDLAAQHEFEYIRFRNKLPNVLKGASPQLLQAKCPEIRRP